MVEHDFYYLFDEAYSVRGETEMNFTNYDLPPDESSAFLREVAHQFDDLVDQ